MDKTESLAMMRELSLANGVSGFEEEVSGALARMCAGFGGTRTDSMNSLYVTLPDPSKPAVLLDAHIDEVGFMIHSINEDGTMRFVTLGSWSAVSVPAHPVRVRNADGNYVPGIIASKPPHYQTEAERTAAVPIDAMVIDVGARSRQEAAEAFGIRIGAPVVPDAEFRYLEDSGLLYGKAFDCRLGCAALVRTLSQLSGERLGVSLTGVFAAQEEVGVRGARVAARTVNPDCAIVFEGTPADDTLNGSYQPQTRIKSGPMLRHIDAGMITNPRFLRFVLDTACQESIPVQEGVRTGGSTNGAAIHLSGAGVPTVVIGVPVRYIHTHLGFAAYSDWEGAVSLACAVIRRLDKDVLASF